MSNLAETLIRNLSVVHNSAITIPRRLKRIGLSGPKGNREVVRAITYAAVEKEGPECLDDLVGLKAN